MGSSIKDAMKEEQLIRERERGGGGSLGVIN